MWWSPWRATGTRWPWRSATTAWASGPLRQQLVFDRFWRADPARARTTGGTGLGLAIALEDARLHNGWLQAWGECGKGSVFRLTVPRTAGDELAGSPLPLGPDEAEPGPELIQAPLPLRVSQVPPGPGLAGAGLPGSGFAGTAFTGTPHAAVHNTAIRHAHPEHAHPEHGDRAGRPGAARVRPVQLTGPGALVPGRAGRRDPGGRLRGRADQRAAPAHGAACGQWWRAAGVELLRVHHERAHPRLEPVQIVQGFVLASADFANDHGIARQYLTRAASRSWQPGPGPAVTVIAGQPTATLARTPFGSQNTAVVEISAQELGNVSTSGQYLPAEAGQRQLNQEFTLQRVDHQWRIATLPPARGNAQASSGVDQPSHVLMLTKDLFQLAFHPRNLYYLNPAGQGLVPDPVFVPVNSEDPAADLVRALLISPQGWLKGAVLSAFRPQPRRAARSRSCRAARPRSSTCGCPSPRPAPRRWARWRPSWSGR